MQLGRVAVAGGVGDRGPGRIGGEPAGNEPFVGGLRGGECFEPGGQTPLIAANFADLSLKERSRAREVGSRESDAHHALGQRILGRQRAFAVWLAVEIEREPMIRLLPGGGDLMPAAVADRRAAGDRADPADVKAQPAVAQRKKSARREPILARAQLATKSCRRHWSGCERRW